ncbi:large proline-rich protein bag6 isoform X2 [Atheta coriaria]|uniref:large proline-rich protein bag6 isoform X2 n=1 Tax=Dalotia coriaria TaxID=877792 RepID=UPI0031F3F890
MIEITVRTLDSQNHKFNVDDEFTVLQFKQHIASTVNIAAEIQRIIYSGRVLSDEAKLTDLDVNGKVVHLVERPPPSDNPSNNDQPNRPANTLPPQAQQQRLLGGNTVQYLGSMAIPFEPQALVPPPPNFRLAASRLAVARRMLRHAEATIAWLENPSQPRTQNDDVQVEVTPVFEARVIVPASSSENIDENFMNAVHSSLLNNAENMPVNSTMDQATETTSAQENTAEPEGTQSAGSSPEAATTPSSTSVEDLAGPNANPPTNANAQENISRTSEMADLLDTLARLQARFAPFLQRYQTFLREDPVLDGSRNRRDTDRTFNRVSEVLHYFSHAYHSLSDIILRVRSPPPRRLVCRPILIQQTAVVPAGFPIQVEAQINFSSDLPMPNSTSSATQTAGESVRSNATNNVNTESTNPGATGNNGANRTSRMTIPHFEFMNSNVHVQSFPISIRPMRSASTPRPATTTATQNQEAPTSNTVPTDNANAQRGANNPNVEFFMEVTPESITIDSLESSLLGATQTDGGTRGTNVPQPTPEFIQSIMQMAGQLVNRGASTSNISNITVRPPQAATTEATTTSGQSTAPGTPGTPGQNGVPGQNSQARGNTQTHPTTATHTRSTARPHVHFSQHAIQGFDPFLPCNSHHIMHLRRPSTRASTNNNQNQPNNNNVRPQNGNTPTNQVNPVLNLVQGLLGSLQNMYGRRASTPNTGVQTSTSAPASTTTSSGPAPTLIGLSTFMMPQNMGSNDPNSRGPTIAQLLQEAGDQVTGEDIFSDILMLLSQNLTIGDLMHLHTGRLDPLLRIRNEIRTFVADRILEGNAPTPQNVQRAVNKLLNEMQPFLDNLSHLPVRDDIDIIRSTQLLLRNRLPNAINLAVSHRPNSMKALIDHLKMTGRHLCALILHASCNGQQGVEDVMNRLAASYMDGIAPGLQQWTQMETRTLLHEFLLTIDVPTSALQPYIVKTVNSVIAENEPMDVDTAQAATEEEAVSNVLGVIGLDDAEDVPAVVIGSESWHGQVPQDWVPLIARDTQRQRRQSQAPLSDAYLTGMPSKRRKVVTNNKPQGTLPHVISESIRRAVTTTGNVPVANLDAVAEEAGADLSIQSAYRDLLRTSVQASIQDNEDFTPERFPNASSYFSKSQ